MSIKDGKEQINCFSAMDKLATCASRLLRGSRSTPGFCSQNIEDRLQAHHAPMDFSAGHGGRIISDPAEAASVSRSSCPRGLRPGWPGGQGCGNPQLMGSGSKSSLDSASSDRDPGTDLSLSLSLSEVAWFKPMMGREQANSALFPHRHTDGIFIIRSCSRQVSNYVLSFTSNCKIVHAQIIRVSHDGRKAFSLDGAKTKFPCLEHLVDFYKMNSGPLPILLKDTTINSVPPSPSPRSFSSGLKEFNNNSGSADTEHLHRELEHQTGEEGSFSFS